jgi:hypothetical protein
MEPEGSLPRLQLPATSPYPEPDQSSRASPTHYPRIQLTRLAKAVLTFDKISRKL